MTEPASTPRGRRPALLDAARNRRGLVLGTLLFCLTLRPPAAAPADKDARPGAEQLPVAAWSVLIEEPLARALQGQGAALAGKAKNYKGYALGAQALLALLKQGRGAGQVHFVPATMCWFENCDQWIGERILLPNQFGERTEIKKDLFRDGNLIMPAFYRLTATGGRVHLKWHGDGTAVLYEYERLNTQQAPHARVQGTLEYEGDLKAGDALCYLAPLDKARAGSPAWHLIVAQAVPAGADDAPYLTSFVDLKRWLETGPEGALKAVHEAQSAQAAAAPASSRSHPSQPVPPAGMLRLRAIGQPARWPFQWWDGDGNLIAGPPAWQRLAAGNTLTVYLEAQGIEGLMDVALNARDAGGAADAVPVWISPTYEAANTGSVLVRLSVQPGLLNDVEKVAGLLAARTPLELAVTCGTGEWSKIADIQEGKEVRAEGGRFLLQEVKAQRAKTKDWPGLTAFDLNYDFDPACDVMLVGVDRKGNRGKSASAVGGGSFTHRQGRRLFSSIGMEKGAIEHFELLKRPVRTYTFTGIATSPAKAAAAAGN